MLNPPGGFSTITIDGVVRPCTPGTTIVINVGAHTVTIAGRPVKTSTEVMGSGGGGGDGISGAGSGGGGGAFVLAFLLTFLPGKIYTLTAALGGVSDGAGGVTSIVNTTDAVTIWSATGGGAGQTGGGAVAGGAGGHITVGTGTDGQAGASPSSPDGGAGGNSGFGTGSGAGGTSAGNGSPGTVGGGGGGAADTAAAGGAGADGFFAVTFLA